MPIKIDEATKKKSRISSARVLVEDSVEVDFPSSVEAVDVDGNVYKQDVLYETSPT